MLIANKFEIVRELGRGAFGVVFEAKDSYLDRTVAIKTIRDDAFSSPSSREAFEKRFVREARSVAKLQHPHIIAVHEAGRDGELSYIAMEFVKGRTLRDILVARQRLPLPETLRLAQALLSALDYAHSQGIVHRDIKPENLMIREDGILKVADFGIAKALSAESTTLTRDGAVMGTPSYMAPEQVLGKSIDGRADIFSSAALLYEVLAGVKPFQAESLPALVHQILTAEPPPLSQKVAIPAPVEAAIMRGLSKEPAERYQSCGELLQALEAAASGATPSVISRRDAPTHVAAARAMPTRAAAAPASPSVRTVEVPAERPGMSPMLIAGAAVGFIIVLAVLAGAAGLFYYLSTRPAPARQAAAATPRGLSEPSPIAGVPQGAAPPPAPAPMAAPMTSAAQPASMPEASMPPPTEGAAMPSSDSSMTPMPPPSAERRPADPMAGMPVERGSGAPRGAPATDMSGTEEVPTRAQAEIDRGAQEFGRMVESGDWTNLASVFTPDALMINGDGTFRGRATIDAYYRTANLVLVATAAGQPISWRYRWLSFESDGSSATGVTYNVTTVGGRVIDSMVYRNLYRRIGSRWLVASSVWQPTMLSQMGGGTSQEEGHAKASEAKAPKEKKPKKAKRGSEEEDGEVNIDLPVGRVRIPFRR